MTLRIDTPWLRFSVSAEAEGQTIAELLAPWECSKAARYKLEIEQRITLNGQPVRQSAKVKAGDELALKVFQQEEPDFVPWAIPVRILYEDELILAVSKPAGMHQRDRAFQQVSVFSAEAGSGFGPEADRPHVSGGGQRSHEAEGQTDA